MRKYSSLISLMFKRRNFVELLQKNIEIFFGYPLYWISFLFPRNKNKWLIGSHIGFAGNSKYFFIYTTTIKEKKECYWITPSRKESKSMAKKGLNSYYKWSLKGIYHSLTAGVYIFSSHLTDVNYWTSGRVKGVNFWHGVGIKKIEFELSIGSGKKIYDESNIISKIYMPQIFRKPDLFLVTSPLMREHFKHCFRISDDRCFESGYPRNDIFYWDSKKIENFIEKYEASITLDLVNKIKNSRKTYLYMPTWRESRSDFIHDAGFDFYALNSILEKNNDLFLLKLHPDTTLDVSTIEKMKNIVIVDKDIDIYPIFPFTNVLITDYSSVYYDYLLLKGKEIILFPFDYEDYVLNSRDFAFDYDKYMVGEKIYTFSALLDIIEKKKEDNINKKYIIDLFWADNERESSESIYTEIFERLFF